jgi:hypothetical protein
VRAAVLCVAEPNGLEAGVVGTTRRAVVTALVAAGVLLLGGCGQTDGTEGPDGGARGETGAGGGQRIPSELVGSWSTDGSFNFDPTVFSFYEDGFFTQEVGASRAAGRYEVKNGTLLTLPDEGEPKAYAWRLGEGGCLYLDDVKHCPYS